MGEEEVAAVASVVVSTFAGSTMGMPGYGDGFGTAARFQSPTYITSDGNGNLYVTDWNANNIRKVVIATGEVTTFAGSTSGASGVLDSTGTLARFNQPMGITTDGINLYVADSYSHTIRKIVIATQAVTTLAGTAGTPGWADAASGIPATSARFDFPWGIGRIGTNLFVADSYSTIRKIDLSSASAVVTTLAGTPGVYGWNNNLGGASAVFNFPTALTTDGASFVYVTEYGNNDVRKIDASTGMTTHVAGGYYSLPSSGVGSTDAIGLNARFNDPRGIATDGTNLYVADTFNHTIRKIVIATGFVSTLAGAALTPGNTDAAGPSARFFLPYGIVYINGTLYVADYGNRSIRKIQL